MSRDADGRAHALLRLLADSTPEWMADGLCKEYDPDLWFPEGDLSKQQAEQAKEVCSRCLVRDDCLDYAIATRQKWGIWAGTTERDREKLFKALPKGRTRAPLQHGTEYAYRFCTEGPDGGKCDTCRGGHARRGAEYKSRAS